ncbi:hypothetical protein OSTOST_17115 [Ostertagia ostertagi]
MLRGSLFSTGPLPGRRERSSSRQPQSATASEVPHRRRNIFFMRSYCPELSLY